MATPGTALPAATSPSFAARLMGRFAGWDIGQDALVAYAKLLSGQVGRLVFSLATFLILANALSLQDFGLFTTASAVGVVLSRVAAFGFVSPLYRTACARRRLVGSFACGYLAAFALSLPLVATIGAGAFTLVFAGEMGAAAFALVMVAEVVLWRTAEVVVIVNNGLNRFARAAALVIANTALRAGAAGLFLLSGTGDLTHWAGWYATANAVSLAAALLLLPRMRPRWTPRIWLARWRDALGVSAAEVLFYAQSELDKLVVLAFGGPFTAGLYAVTMRLADLTAIPLRAMMTLLVQRIMRERGSLDLRQAGSRRGGSWRAWAALEGGVFAVSVLAMSALALILNLRPGLLGENVAIAAPFVALVLLVPGFRNLVEFHSEVLYAFERAGDRLVQLTLVGAGKAALLVALLGALGTFGPVALWLNAAFAALYVVSALYTYGRLRGKGFSRAERRSNAS